MSSFSHNRTVREGIVARACTALRGRGLLDNPAKRAYLGANDSKVICVLGSYNGKTAAISAAVGRAVEIILEEVTRFCDKATKISLSHDPIRHKAFRAIAIFGRASST